ncbi:MAG: UDP-N-acetylmuramate--L-alanine ligase [Rhodomicrobium sp.]|jgi:UDP-N-acetylmuramate--alanine ligase
MKDPLSGGRMHIIGLGGIGMSAIAEIMAARGLYVQGSDQKDGANLRRLSSKGIKVFVGHEAAHLEDAASVVISTAVKENNPELKAARERGLPVFSRADALAALMKGYRTISITGSHGKTTTTAMVGWMMEQAGLDPTVVVGGIIRAWGSNARIGASRWMVVEADESDGTFIRLPTEIGVVTNIDAEHLDYYGTEAALREAFLTFFRQIPKDGAAIAGIDHPVVRALVGRLQAEGDLPPLSAFGRALDAQTRIDAIATNGGSVTFDAILANAAEDAPFRKNGFKLRMPGAHNALNAAAAIAVGRHAGLELDQIFDALSTFEGVDRRFTQTGEWNGVSIYDDYAHHPAEIAAVLSAARGASKGRVIAVMQPHRYSRLKSLFGEFCGCFGDADTVLVAPVYPAGEQPNGFDRDKLVEGIRHTGHARVYPIEGEDALTRTVASLANPGDLVIGLGAGTISEWARALPGRLGMNSTFAGAAE